MDIDFSQLNLLLNAPSKLIIENALDIVFAARSDNSDRYGEHIQNLLTLESTNLAIELFELLRYCIKITLQTGSIDALVSLLIEKAESVDQRLKKLLIQIISSRLSDWKKVISQDMITLPKLIAFNWEICTDKTSNNVSSMNLPVIKLQLKTDIPIPTTPGTTTPTTTDIKLPQGDSHTTTTTTSSSTTTMELHQDTLSTMIDGLHRIKSQIESLTAFGSSANNKSNSDRKLI